MNKERINEAVLRMFYEYGAAFSKLGNESLTWEQVEQTQKKWIKKNHKKLKKFNWYKNKYEKET